MGFRFCWKKDDRSICSNEAVTYYVVKGKTKKAMPEEERDSSILVKKSEDKMEKCSRTIS